MTKQKIALVLALYSISAQFASQPVCETMLVSMAKTKSISAVSPSTSLR